MEDGEVQQDLATSSSPNKEQPLNIVTTEPITPRSSSLFHPPPPFLTISASGTYQKVTARSSPMNRDYSPLGSRRKSDDLLALSEKHISLKRDEKIEQLERMVFNLQQEVFSLKQKVHLLEASSSKEPEAPHQPCEADKLFNGYTREQLREAIRFDQKISTACKTLLHKLFTSDYIQSHSITGRRGNTFREAKPMMDERCIKIIRVLLKQKFGDHLSDTVITEKIQNVQKALRQKYKAECL
ncbi:uncharacterized protein LOC132567214 [Heteronotia binoei]|uniref:uncharacterized protein LOC132567214 n=1 Tax=Heteronotia binoei TaxID=13085 RepID=UPI002930B53E|nr:uncharacterized protein LOC132567214 [Heteronotia binoei]